MSNHPHLYLKRRDEVAHLVIDRPKRRNAFTDEMWPVLSELAREAEQDPRIDVMVIMGADAKVFSAGADVADWVERLERGGEGAGSGLGVSEAIGAIADMTKPTVAAIRGACMGGGAAIAMACDLRVADDGARFSLPPARVGLAFPYPALRSLVAAVGEARAKWLLFTGEVFGGVEAHRIGLVSALFEAGSFDSELSALLKRVCAMSQASLRTMKEMMGMVAGGQTAQDGGIERMWRELATGPDHEERIRRFLKGLG